MPLVLSDSLQTLARAYQDICAGENPWVALGNFANEWYVYAPDRREELVSELPQLPNGPTLNDHRWAAFAAASAEYLCQQAALPCPEWVNTRQYWLETPWYDVPVLTDRVRAWLEETTPEPFRRRNIYCGDQLYTDKMSVVVHPVGMTRG